MWASGLDSYFELLFIKKMDFGWGVGFYLLIA